MNCKAIHRPTMKVLSRKMNCKAIHRPTHEKFFFCPFCILMSFYNENMFLGGLPRDKNTWALVNA